MQNSDTVVLSSKKYKELKNELDYLKGTGRKEIADKLDLYREESEEEDSIPYSELLQEKQAMEVRISEIEELLEKAIVSDSCRSNGSADLGCDVEITKGRQKKVFRLVSSVESNPEEGKLSENSPLGKALMGKKPGQEVVVKTPNGEEKWKIEKVK